MLPQTLHLGGSLLTGRPPRRRKGEGANEVLLFVDPKMEFGVPSGFPSEPPKGGGVPFGLPLKTTKSGC